MRTLHHVDRPELVVAELARVVRPGGAVLVVDQLAPADPDAAAAVEAFERARDPEHARLLTDAELRGLFDRNGLEVVREQHDTEARAVAAYLDLAACTGEERERAERLAPHGTKTFEAEVGWYLLRA
jgi:ubiquinone/menaquinone biosynthesis C-methylase UbiE